MGAQGLIGSVVSRRLVEAGYQVVGLKRTPPAVGASDLDWVFCDLRAMVSKEDWKPVLDGVSHVVNAAGALQDGGQDDLNAVHVAAPEAMSKVAAERGMSIVQISAAGVSLDATTEFFRTKAKGDAAVLASGAPATILRPSLVIARDAYGGTALIRALTSVPFVQPVALGDATVQTVDVEDVANAVLYAIRGDLAPGTYDVTSPVKHTLEEILLEIRSWLGVSQPRTILRIPARALAPIAWMSDWLGKLGWRSPLRTTALRVLQDGVTGDSENYALKTGSPPRSLKNSLAEHPATNADLVSARMALVLPVLIGVLSMFWMASGVIGLTRVEAAAGVLTGSGWHPASAFSSVVVFSLADIAIGVAILWKKWAKLACIAMVALSLLYLLSATIFTPHLWFDPLGPLLKVIPATVAAIVALALLGSRR